MLLQETLIHRLHQLCHEDERVQGAMLYGSFSRGEAARALEVLHLVQDYLLRMVRLKERVNERWQTAAKAAEGELSPAGYARLRTCTAHLERESLAAAYREAWTWGNELLGALADRHGVLLSAELKDRFQRRISENIGRSLAADP